MSVMTKMVNVEGLLRVASAVAAAEYEAPNDRSAKVILAPTPLKGQC